LTTPSAPSPWPSSRSSPWWPSRSWPSSMSCCSRPAPNAVTARRSIERAPPACTAAAAAGARPVEGEGRGRGHPQRSATALQPSQALVPHSLRLWMPGGCLGRVGAIGVWLEKFMTHLLSPTTTHQFALFVCLFLLVSCNCAGCSWVAWCEKAGHTRGGDGGRTAPDTHAAGSPQPAAASQ
jgi:hypothetical protein